MEESKLKEAGLATNFPKIDKTICEINTAFNNIYELIERGLNKLLFINFCSEAPFIDGVCKQFECLCGIFVPKFMVEQLLYNLSQEHYMKPFKL